MTTTLRLAVGDEAPDFTAETTEGTIQFHQWLGNGWGVLFSRPTDFTPICSTEAGVAGRITHEFDRRGVKVIALSINPHDAHENWSRDFRQTRWYAPHFPIVADANRTVANLYAMIHSNADDTATVRSVIVIGPDKIVRLAIDHPQSTGYNSEEILRVIDSLRLTATHRESTPVQSHATDGVITNPAVSPRPNDHERRTCAAHPVHRAASYTCFLTPAPRTHHRCCAVR